MQRSSTKKPSQRLLPYLFMLPAIGIFLFVYAGPMLASMFLSVTDWNGIAPSFSIVGFQNYARIFSDRKLLEPLGNTFMFTLCTVVVQSILALVLAVVLNKKFWGRDIFRTVIFMPCVVSMVAVGYAWSLIYNPVMGPLAKIAAALDWQALSNIKWLSDPNLALYSIVIVNIWQWTGWSMVIYLAGLQSIPGELYEAGAIDGAGTIGKFFHITLPQIVPSITICVVMSTIGGLKAFDLMYIMTNGGPGHATQTVAMMIVEAQFRQKQAGLGSAMSIVLFCLILLISALQNKMLSRGEEGANGG